MSSFGRYIIRARERRGWHRADLARKSGVPYTTLRHIETAKKDVQTSEVHLRALANALGETDIERDDMFEMMRILAGYLAAPSKDADDRDRRLLANIDAFPQLRRSLEELFRTGDAAEIDRANDAIELARRITARRLKEPQ